MMHLMKKKSKVGYATKSRKKFKAFMPDPNPSSDEEDVHIIPPGMNVSFSQIQPQNKTKIVPMATDEIPEEQYKNWTH